MLRIMWNSSRAMMAQQEKLDSISNNLANVNTDGYKKVNVGFKDLVYESLKRNGYPLATENAEVAQNGTGVKATDWIRDDAQGSLKETDINTDLAIDGQGYFKITLPNGGTGYTRSGSFNIDSAGDLVDKNGNRVEISFTNGKVPFSQGNFQVSKTGEVSIKDGNNTNVVGKINLYNVIGSDSLTSIGNNIYVAKPGSQVYVSTNSNLEQGFVEGSNVDLGSEMTDMILAQRAFELSSKGMKTADDMWGIANNLRGK